MYRALLLLLTLLASPAPAGDASGAPAAAPAAPGECVILLHGLWRTELSMLAVKWKLEDAGYTVASVTYPSLTHPIEQLAEMSVTEGLQECREQSVERIHFVTHSLGGILLRQYLAGHDIAELGRAVMLGPPNQGSQLAEYLLSLELLSPFRPIPLPQLGTGENSVPRKLGRVDFQVGVIAGNLSRRPPLPGLPPEPSDGTLAVEETRVAGMVDFIEVEASHSFMMWDREVLEQIVYFLQHGSFNEEGVKAVPAREFPHGPRSR